jgi:hypothetical protein
MAGLLTPAIKTRVFFILCNRSGVHLSWLTDLHSVTRLSEIVPPLGYYDFVIEALG